MISHNPPAISFLKGTKNLPQDSTLCSIEGYFARVTVCVCVPVLHRVPVLHMSGFYIFLTVHLRTILVSDQLDAQFLL